MAYVIGNQNRSLGLRDRLGEMVQAYREARRMRAVYRETLNELLGMSDRELADIGIARSEIRAVAMRAAEDQMAKERRA